MTTAASSQALGTPPRLYLITDRRQTAGRPLAAVVAQALGAVRSGRVPPAAVAVQLREKDLHGQELFALATALRAVTRAAGVRLFINDRIDVALAVGADGVHLGGGALEVTDVEAIAPRLAIAVSTHSADEVGSLEGARHGDRRVNFAQFGPVFETPSKRPFGPPLGLERLRDAVTAAAGMPLVAVGGIDRASARSCIEAGASGVALIRAVLSDGAPERALSGIFEAIEST
ncbi:MAG TPA: thiamine phosphate synthase [Polyangia bacterium]